MIHELPAHEDRAFKQYLEWLHVRTRVHLRPTIAGQNLGPAGSTDVPADEYDARTRVATQVERAPVERLVVSILINANSMGIEKKHALCNSFNICAGC